MGVSDMVQRHINIAPHADAYHIGDGSVQTHAALSASHGVTGTIAGIEDIRKVISSAASDTLIASNDAQKDSPATVYTLQKEIVIGRNFAQGCVLRVKGTIEEPTNTNAVYYKVYVNGVAVGAEHLVNGTPPASFSDDIPSLKQGDRIQMYGHCTAAGQPGRYTNFRLCGDLTVYDDFANTVV